MPFKVGEHRLLIPGPAGDLEALFSIQDGAQKIAICCHPHPLYGGTMTNKVVHTLHRTFFNHGMNTLRFNFRGVGKSHGSYADGIGEVEDVNAVVSWVAEKFPSLAVGMAGFSFGAYVSLKAAEYNEFNFMVTVAPPVERFYFKQMILPQCPWILIQPMADEVVNPQSVIKWFDSLNLKSETTRLIKIADASHFFHGKLVELKQQLSEVLDAFNL